MQPGDTPTLHPLVARLRAAVDLSIEERSALGAISFGTATYKAGQQILRAGDRPSRSILLLEGLVSNSKLVGTGKSQIMSLHIPGDMPIQMMHPEWAIDVDITAISDCRLACFDPAEVWGVCQRFPRISWVLWEIALVVASIHREWIVNVGHRPAISRLAHLFCETMARLEASGLADGESCDLPLTHDQLSDAIGLSRVHVTRSMKELRIRGLITFDRGRLTIHDHEALAQVGCFRPDYLYLRQALSKAA